MHTNRTWRMLRRLGQLLNSNCFNCSSFTKEKGVIKSFYLGCRSAGDASDNRRFLVFQLDANYIVDAIYHIEFAASFANASLSPWTHRITISCFVKPCQGQVTHSGFELIDRGKDRQGTPTYIDKHPFLNANYGGNRN